MSYEPGVKAIKFKKCRHMFHSDCIVLWLKMKTSCPMCKADKKEELTAEDQGATTVIPENEEQVNGEALFEMEDLIDDDPNGDIEEG